MRFPGLTDLDAVGHGQDLCVRVFQEFFNPVVEIDAVTKHELRIGHGAGSAGAGIEVVGIGAGLEDHCEVHVFPRYFPNEGADLRRGRDDFDAGPGGIERSGIFAAGDGDEPGNGEE
jgi:hypothetical protein